MKRILSIFLTLLMLFAIGCSSSKNTVANQQTTDGDIFDQLANGQTPTVTKIADANTQETLHVTPAQQSEHTDANQVVSVCVSETCAAAILSDGSLWMWGNKTVVGGSEDSFRPVKIMEDVQKVYLYRYSAAAIKTDGSLYLWGFNEAGMLGTGKESISIDFNYQAPQKVLDNVDSFMFGKGVSTFCAALKTDGTLWSWGSNDEGQLGNGRVGGVQYEPIEILDDVKSFTLGNCTAAAIKQDNTLWTWGANDCGQLGFWGGDDRFGWQYHQTVPIQVLENVQEIQFSSYGDYAAAIKTDNSLWTWGNNFNNQLGNGGASNHVDIGNTPCQSTPTHILDNVVSMCLAGSDIQRMAAILDDGSLWAWGTFIEESGSQKSDRPQMIMEKVLLIDMEQYDDLALMADHSVYNWNRNGRSTNEILNDVRFFTIVDQSQAFPLTYAAIKNDGTLWMWGYNEYGQCGVLTETMDVYSPTKVVFE